MANNSAKTDNDNLKRYITNVTNQIDNAVNNLQYEISNNSTNTALVNKNTERIKWLNDLKTEIGDYQGLTNTVYTNNSNNAQTLGEFQSRAQKIIAEESKNNDERLAMLNAEKYNKVRLIQNNVYYGKYYNAHKQIMKTIFLVCVPILILLILGNMGYIPPNLKSIIIMIIIVIGCVSIGYQIIDLTNRDNMNFDAYNWKFNKKLAPPIQTNVAPFDPWATPSISLGCVNGACCPVGYEYKLTPDNKCVLKSTSS